MAAISPFYFYLIVAVILIGLELAVFQLSIFWLLFIGIGALHASLVVWLMDSDSWLLSTAVFVTASVVVSVGLYQPLSRWQKKAGPLSGNSAIGQSVIVVEAISADVRGKVHWSGTDWAAQLSPESDTDLSVGQTAVITKLEGIRLFVKAG